MAHFVPNFKELEQFIRDKNYAKVADALKYKSVEELDDFKRSKTNLLHLAVEVGDVRIVELLCKRGVKTDVRSHSEKGRTPLHLAAKKGDEAVVKILLDHMAVAMVKDEDGCQPAHLAAKYGHVKVLEKLKQRGCDLQAADSNGSTLIHYAAEGGYVHMVEWLQANKVHVWLRNNDRDYPVDIAKKKGHIAMTNWLNKDNSAANTPSAGQCNEEEIKTTFMSLAAEGKAQDLRTLLSRHKSLFRDSAVKRQYGEKALLDAAAKEHWEVVKILLDHSISPRAKNAQGAGALHYAAGKGNHSVVLALLRAKAEVESCDNDGVQPLHCAAMAGNYDVVKVLLQNQAWIEAPDNKGFRAVHYAACHGHKIVLSALKERGCQIDTQTQDYSTALHLAAERGNTDIVKWLVKEGSVDVSRKNAKHMTALELAKQANHCEVTRFLESVHPKASSGLGWQVAGKTATHDGFSAGLSRGTGNQRNIPIQHDYNTRSTTRMGHTTTATGGSRHDSGTGIRGPGHAANYTGTVATGGNRHDSGTGIRGPGHAANYTGTVATGGSRHDSGTGNLNTVEATQYMLDAASKGNTELVENMLQMGADIHGKSFTGQDKGGDALHLAADNGHTQVVRLLLEKGASVKAQDESGATALHLAAQAGHSEVVKLLIRKGADPDIVDKEGFTVIHTAAVGGHESVLDALSECHFRAVRTGNGQTPLHLAADYGNLEAVKWLVRKGINFNLKDDRGYTALHYATEEANKSVVEFLNQQVLEQQRKFLEAAEQGSLRVVQELLKSGVDVNCTRKGEDGNDQGTTAVHFAAKGGHLEILKMLKQEGGKVRVCNIDNTTPLHFAAAYGHLDVAQWLLEQGVDKSIKTTSKGLTAEDLASRKRHYNIAHLVKDHLRTAATQGDDLLPIPLAHGSQMGSYSSHTAGAGYGYRQHTGYGYQKPQELWKVQKSKGLPQGLKSLGNTCYMNAVTQCLFNTSPLTEYVLSQAFRSSINLMSQSRGEIANSFGTVMQLLENYGDSYSAMQNFKRKVEEQDRLFRGNRQQEAQDFLSTLLDSLDKDLTAFGRSHIADLFFGQHRSTITCLLRGELLSQMDEPFLCLTLPVVMDYMTRNVSLQSLLENYYRPREIEWDCPGCNRSHPCKQEMKVLKLPKIMIIHFSRFSGGTAGRYKQLVDFPDVCNDFSNSIANGTERKRKYSLYGVCSHYGTMHSGHYVATCRNKRDKSQWFSFNDEEVREVSGPSKDGAHILFYEDVGEVDPSLKERAYGVANKVIQFMA